MYPMLLQGGAEKTAAAKEAITAVEESVSAAAETAMTFGDSIKLSVVGMLVVMAMLVIIAVFIMIVSRVFKAAEKAFGAKNGEQPHRDAAQPAAEPAKIADEVTLENVDEPTAAVIMAIVSHETGIAPERLAFKSIKLIGEDRK